MLKNFHCSYKKVVAVSLAAIMLLCGCDVQSLTDGRQDDTTTAETSVGEGILSVGGEGDAEVYPEGYPVTINDTEIKRPPEKAACLTRGLTEMIYELGFGDKLVGRGSYCDHPEEALSLSDLGKPTAPDISAIKAAAPDILITATAVANKDVVELAESGISVVYIPAPHSVDEFSRIYSALGMIFEGMFDGEDDGNKVFLDVKKKLTGQNVSLGRFVYLTEGLHAAGGDTFEGSVLSLFGTNIAESASGYSFDVSALVTDPPDVVILNSDISPAELAADSTIGILAEGKVISVSNSYFESPSGRITELAEVLGQELAEAGG